MIKKALFLILFFYILSLLQTSFWVHFNILGITPNFVLILAILIILFTSHQNWWGVGSAFIGGFFLDIFSSQFIGWNILFLLLLAILVKIIFKRYVRSPIY